MSHESGGSRDHLHRVAIYLSYGPRHGLVSRQVARPLFSFILGQEKKDKSGLATQD